MHADDVAKGTRKHVCRIVCDVLLYEVGYL